MNSARPHGLDEIDRKILVALQRDGRLTNLELAETVGLSPSPCLRRVRYLETSGVLKHYVGLVDPAAVGLDITAFIRVALERQGDAQLERFEKSIAQWPEVLECYLMTGDADYQLRVVARSLAEYESFLRDKLTKLSGIAKIQSSLAFRPIISRTALPIHPAAA